MTQVSLWQCLQKQIQQIFLRFLVNSQMLNYNCFEVSTKSFFGVFNEV